MRGTAAFCVVISQTREGLAFGTPPFPNPSLSPTLSHSPLLTSPPPPPHPTPPPHTHRLRAAPTAMCDCCDDSVHCHCAGLPPEGPADLEQARGERLACGRSSGSSRWRGCQGSEPAC